jgi:glycosyltransferase involved in cell wall biosynthesis
MNHPSVGSAARCRIARIITRLSVGGSERYVCALAQYLDPRRFQSWLIHGQADANERQWSELTALAGVEPIFLAQLRRKPGVLDVAALFRMVRLLRAINPAIVETHTAKAGAIGRIATILAFPRERNRPRMIHTFHGHVFDRYFSRRSTQVFLAIERRLARSTDMIVTVSERTRRELVDQYAIAPGHKVRSVTLGFDFDWLVDLPRKRGWLRERLGAGDSTVIFGAVGRLAAIKNTEMLLCAFARMLANAPGVDARLVLIGDGELRESLQSLVYELGIANRVLFCGWVLNRAEIYCDLDVVCLSSLNEGLPVCLIEGLAAGLPVVSTNVGGVAEIVTPGLDGELVESGDVAGLTTALLKMAVSKVRIAPRRSAAIRARHSTARMVGQIENLYREVLDLPQEERATA